MKVLTQYHYENKWTLTSEKDLHRMIEEEIGDADVAGTLVYVKEVLSKGKVMSIGTCKFKSGEENVSK